MIIEENTHTSQALRGAKQPIPTKPPLSAYTHSYSLNHIEECVNLTAD